MKFDPLLFLFLLCAVGHTVSKILDLDNYTLALEKGEFPEKTYTLILFKSV